MKKLKIKDFLCLGVLTALLLFPVVAAWADDAPAVAEDEMAQVEGAEPAAPAAPQSELDKLKDEWEAVREQQIQMIREKEDQLEKLKEEIFAKMKSGNASAAASTVEPQSVPPLSVPASVVASSGVTIAGGSAELETQKAALQVERQKFFKEMSRQKQSLRELQASLDEKAKQLAAERERFEIEKKSKKP